MHIHYLSAIRAQNPLIHNITSAVAANFSANGLLALGASPLMAESPAEAAELAAHSAALVLNIGTPSQTRLEAMQQAGAAANRAGVPVILDPVAVGASAYRRDTIAALLQHIRFAAIRGNAGELAYLADVPWQNKGADAGEGHGDRAAIARTVATRYHCIAVLSGARDYSANGQRVATLDNGTPLLPRITASGCLLSTVLGAFLAVAPAHDHYQAACEACAAYAIAGEQAAAGLAPTQSGSFAACLIDALAAIRDEDIARAARLHEGDASWPFHKH